MKNCFKYLFVALAAISILISGCTHQMTVKNLNDYYTSPTTNPSRVDVALAPYRGPYELSLFYQKTAAALGMHPSVRMVRVNWSPKRTEKDFNPSHIVYLAINANYEGSGWNYPITFPGGYFFVCAITGYVYYANLTTDISASPICNDADLYKESTKNNQIINESIPMKFSLRHCDFTRGFWSGTAWWFPGWGLHNIITGFVFIGYDPDATVPFVQKSADVYGNYIADKIVTTLLKTQNDQPKQSEQPENLEQPEQLEQFEQQEKLEQPTQLEPLYKSEQPQTEPIEQNQ